MKTTIIILLLLTSLAATAHAADRVALVIGCARYSGLNELSTCVNDANDLATTLRAAPLNFECIVVNDPGVEQFYEGLAEFKAKAAGVRVAMIFFSGHGIEHDGQNYLIPVDAQLDRATQLKTQAVNLTSVMDELKASHASVKLAVLDCCRDTPFRQTKDWNSSKSVKDSVLRELGEAELPQSTLVCFATSAGRKAAAVLDEHSRNSPFTESLISEIKSPGRSLRDVFDRVHDRIKAATQARQEPAVKTDNAASEVFRHTVLVPGDRPPEADMTEAKRQADYESLRRDYEKLRADVMAQKSASPIPTSTAAVVVPEPKPLPSQMSPWLFPDSSRRYLTASDVSSLSSDELWKARNEIYARKGYVFTTPRGIQYMNSLDGYYSPVSSDQEAIESRFNEYEKSNVEKIKTYE